MLQEVPDKGKSPRYFLFAVRSLVLTAYLWLFAASFPLKTAFAQGQPEQLSQQSPAELPAQETPTPSPVPEKTEEVGPLEVWVPAKKLPTKDAGGGEEKKKEEEDGSLPPQGPEDAEIAEEKKIFEQLMRRYKKDVPKEPTTAPVVKRIILTKEQKKRLELATKVQAKILRSQEHKVDLTPDPRGVPELRVCTLNLNSYGKPKVLKRVVRSNIRVASKEKAILSALKQADCSVVGIQGVIGSKYLEAKQGLDDLVEKLQRETGRKWRAYLGNSNSRFAYDGFLVVEAEEIGIEGIKSYADLPLTQFGDFKEQSFARGPVELILQVRGRGNAETKTVVLFTASLTRTLDGKVNNDERYRMQMAEAVRRLVEKEAEELTRPDAEPVVVLLADRSGPCCSPSADILEGSRFLRDFRSESRCVLKENVKVEKKQKKEKAKGKKERDRKTTKLSTFTAECRASRRPKILFGLLRENTEPVKIVKRNVEGQKEAFIRESDSKKRLAKRTKREKRTAEIYVMQRDLPFFWRNANGVTYTVGSAEIKFGAQGSPLIAADLNW